MTYRVRIKKSAAKSLEKLADRDRFRVIQAIDRLAVEPHAGGVLKGEFEGLRRLRVGRFRIIYEVIAEELTVLVVRVGHRREVYR